jgi:hypothetical protein
MKYGVTANALSPGAQTRMVATIPDMSRMGSGLQGRRSFGPEYVAPAVVYVSSKASGWFTGQVFGARGTSISLYSRPQVVREISTSGDNWDLEDVFERFEAVFRPAVENTENFYEQVAKMDTAKARAADETQAS